MNSDRSTSSRPAPGASRPVSSDFLSLFVSEDRDKVQMLCRRMVSSSHSPQHFIQRILDITAVMARNPGPGEDAKQASRMYRVFSANKNAAGAFARTLLQGRNGNR